MRLVEQLLGPLRRPVATTKYPESRPALANRRSRGTPQIDAELCRDDHACVEVCPVAAITAIEASEGCTWSLDYGRCIFCGECVRACPSGAIAATPDFELAVRARGMNELIGFIGRSQANG